MNYWQEHYGEKHYCNKYDCRPPSKLERHQFCSSFYQTIRPHPTGEYKLEFVPLTAKQIAEQQRLPQHWRLPLSYGFPQGGVRRPEDDPSKSVFDWPISRLVQDYTQPVQGYYKYTLIKPPGESSGSGGKLFWLTVIGATVWFWFVR
jgi:hypothetical protein